MPGHDVQVAVQHQAGRPAPTRATRQRRPPVSIRSTAALRLGHPATKSVASPIPERRDVS